jgi:hypothetical protein
MIETDTTLREAAPDLLEALQDWIWYADGALTEFDLDGDECDPEGDLCPRCVEVGCIQRKIRAAKAAVIKAGHVPRVADVP